ncbi:MAG: hypothetical protein NTV79_01815 [Candidatus Aureabacteria bacterium]|nr:hypothetical protein [Candidatus Auribacterota bacterium]
MGSARALLLLLLGAALLGATVLILNKNYRRPCNIVSNRNFYSVLAQK